MAKNATVTCRLCHRIFDKGVPVDHPSLEGQRAGDETFVCSGCATIEGGYPQDGRRSTREELHKYRADVPPPAPALKRPLHRRIIDKIRGKK